jgi:hypothetical protein
MRNRPVSIQQARIDPASVVGWGIDADPKNDPTYPMRDILQDDQRGMSWRRPALQPDSVEVLRSTEHNRRTAVFGTSTPPSGLSGAIRRRAFHRSEGKWGHWLMLLAADRINMVEGLVQDFGRGKIPNIPAEMGLHSEIRHNLPGFATKVVIAGAVLTAAIVAARSLRSSPDDNEDQRRSAAPRRSPPHVRSLGWEDRPGINQRRAALPSERFRP